MYNTTVNDQAYVMKVTGRQEMHAILLFKRKTIVQAIYIWIQKNTIVFHQLSSTPIYHKSMKCDSDKAS